MTGPVDLSSSTEVLAGSVRKSFSAMWENAESMGLGDISTLGDDTGDCGRVLSLFDIRREKVVLSLGQMKISGLSDANAHTSLKFGSRYWARQRAEWSLETSQCFFSQPFCWKIVLELG